MPRRCVIRVVVLLALLICGGAIVNVAVAWGCTQFSKEGFDLEFETLWAQLGTTMTDGSRTEFRAFQTSKGTGVDIIGQPGLNPLHNMTIELAVGWPSRSMHCWAETCADQWVFTGRRLKLPETPGRGPWFTLFPRHHELPLEPLWPGFAINTIFYAAVLWAVFFVPGKLKRTLRRRRGLCPACAYPWGAGTSPVCTECGKPIP